MASLQLMTAVMVALFAVGLGAEHHSSGKDTSACFDLEFAMNRLSPDLDTDAEEAFELATKVFENFDEMKANKGRSLYLALSAVVDRSNCSELSLDIVKTIADCKLWRSDSTESLDEAAKAYAQKCLTADYIRDRIDSSINDEARNLAKILDHQFFVDYKSEFPKNRQMRNRSRHEEKFAKALANAILRDPQGHMETIKEDVHGYLKERLYAPCSSFKKAFRKVSRPLWLVKSYVANYEKLISSLDESTREQFSRDQFCEDLQSGATRNSVADKVARQLQSASA